MIILPLVTELSEYLRARKLLKKFEKQKILFEQNPFYPGLNTELLEPREMKLWSFRLDKKYRVIFIFHDSNTVEIVDINNHYK
ncbi:MAG: type II toxin-antitoxin system RelE/ParE family toxin [Candidatus Paceibacterota bacterium]|jgi:plasmid maintenance system killer protein